MPFVGVLSFSISVFNGLAVLVLDGLGKPGLKILDKSISYKTLIVLHLFVRELKDHIMGLNVVLN